MLLSILANVIATLAVFPLISFVLIYFILTFWTKDKKVALHWSINITTILIIISIPLTLQLLWGISLFWLMILMIAFIAIGLTYLQYVVHGEIMYDRLVRGIIRLIFIFFLPIHVVLYAWVVVRSIFIAM